MRVPEAVDTLGRTAVAMVALPAILIAHSAAAAALALLGGTPRRLQPVYRSFARAALRVGGTSLEVHGAERLRRDRAYVLVSNHESNWDPIAIVGALPDVLVRFIVKRQLMRIPIFGQALRLTGNVRVERDHTRGDVDRIRRGMQLLPPEVSVLFFAEGTRSRDGALHDFKMGAFATALAHGLPILPAALSGTRRIMPPEKLVVRRGPVVIEIGEPIPVEGLGYEHRAALRDQTREAVVKLRARARQRLRDLGVEPGGVD